MLSGHRLTFPKMRSPVIVGKFNTILLRALRSDRNDLIVLLIRAYQKACPER